MVNSVLARVAREPGLEPEDSEAVEFLNEKAQLTSIDEIPTFALKIHGAAHTTPRTLFETVALMVKSDWVIKYSRTVAPYIIFQLMLDRVQNMRTMLCA